MFLTLLLACSLLELGWAMQGLELGGQGADTPLRGVLARSLCLARLGSLLLPVIFAASQGDCNTSHSASWKAPSMGVTRAKVKTGCITCRYAHIEQPNGRLLLCQFIKADKLLS